MAVFTILLTTWQLLRYGLDLTVLLGYVLGVVLLVAMKRQKILKALIVLIGIPCILLSMITGTFISENYHGGLYGFVAGGISFLLYREYESYLRDSDK